MVWFGSDLPNSVSKLWYADASRPGTTRMVRFDDAFPSLLHIDLIKLDLEGGELDAIRGMRNTLLKHHPVVVCETADWLPQQKDGPGRQALFTYMADLGYEVAETFGGDTVFK
jgi:hypothetical protein